MAKVSSGVRAKVLGDLEASLEKTTGLSVKKYGEMGDAFRVETITTGSIAADYAIGGGFPVGRISMLAGHTSSGKTSLAITAAAQLQKKHAMEGLEPPVILYVDAEAAFDPDYAESLGLDVESIYLIRPDYGEEGYEIAEKFANSGVCDLIIIDSIAALVPKIFFENEMGDQNKIGEGARLDSKGIGRIFGPAAKNNVTVILINQFKKAVRTNSYERTDGISGNYYLPGGETVKFYLSVLAEIQRVGKIYDKDEHGNDFILTNQTRIRLLKNKIAPAGREADYFLTFGKGIDRAQEAIELGIQLGLVNRSSARHSVVSTDVSQKMAESLGLASDPLDGHSTLNGRAKFAEWLEGNPEVLDHLIATIRSEFSNSKDQKIGLAEGTEVESEYFDQSS